MCDAGVCMYAMHLNATARASVYVYVSVFHIEEDTTDWDSASWRDLVYVLASRTFSVWPTDAICIWIVRHACIGNVVDVAWKRTVIAIQTMLHLCFFFLYFFFSIGHCSMLPNARGPFLARQRIANVIDTYRCDQRPPSPSFEYSIGLDRSKRNTNFNWSMFDHDHSSLTLLWCVRIEVFVRIKHNVSHTYVCPFWVCSSAPC